MKTLSVRPTKKLETIIALYNSANAAAEAFGVPYSTLTAWLDDKGDLPSRHAASILERTRLPYEDLFLHVEDKR